jgi:methionyl-tRNA formyltransferase
MTEIVFLGLNDIGERVYDWLTDREDATVLALLTEQSQLDVVKRLEPDLIVSAGFRHIVPEEVISIPDLVVVNFHKSYLPDNRGANPNVWSIIEDSPAGITLHYMTPEMDGGTIIDKREISVRPDDTGLSLYERLEAAQFGQFRECWPAIRDDAVETTAQDLEGGTVHYKQDFVELWPIDRDETVRAGDFLDRLRALTFPPFKNAFFEVDGERYYVEIDITSEDDTPSEPSRKIPPYSEDELP